MSVYDCDVGGGRGVLFYGAQLACQTMAGPVSLALIEAFQRVFAEKPTLFGCFRVCYLGFD